MFLGQWSEAFRPVKDQLLPPLADIFRDRQRGASGGTHPGDEPPGRLRRRPAAGSGRSAHGRRREAVRRDLSEVQGARRARAARADRRDRQETAAGPALLGRQREKLAKRQANAAVALLRMNQPAKVWPLLKHSPDPRVRSYLIHRLGPLGADARAIVKRLDEEPDLTIRRALLLSLGEYRREGFHARTTGRRCCRSCRRSIARRRRSGPSCGGGMAVADVEAGGVAETGERGMGEGQGAAGEAAGGHRARSLAKDTEPRRRRSGTSTAGSDDGGDSRPGGVPDGFAADRRDRRGSMRLSTRGGSVGRLRLPPSR